jgi:hypothetical protein
LLRFRKCIKNGIATSFTHTWHRNKFCKVISGIPNLYTRRDKRIKDFKYDLRYALEAYTGTSYGPMNQALRSGIVEEHLKKLVQDGIKAFHVGLHWSGPFEMLLEHENLVSREQKSSLLRTNSWKYLLRQGIL